MERVTQSTRRQIVDLIKTNGGMTAKQVSKQLGISAMGVRRHLTALERDGMLAVRMVRQKMGRPTFVYTLTDQAQDLFPKTYHTLATQLLDAARETAGEGGIDTLFSARMEQLLRQYRVRMEGKNLAERVAELSKIQEEAGYMATWTPTEGGFILREQNCAIFRVACHFQQACHYEIELFQRLLDADITRLQHQVVGEPYCTYFVRERRPPAAPKAGAREKVTPARSRQSR